MEGHVLQNVIAFMYGQLTQIPGKLLLPVFKAAHTLQVAPQHFQCFSSLSANKQTEVGALLLIWLTGMQVDSLQEACRNQLMSKLYASTVLECAAAADAVDDQILMEACLNVWSTSEARYQPLHICCPFPVPMCPFVSYT